MREILKLALWKKKNLNVKSLIIDVKSTKIIIKKANEHKKKEKIYMYMCVCANRS